MTALLRAAALLATAVVTLTLQASCARSVTSDIPSDPAFFGANTKNPAPLGVCVSTDCPAPWASCPGGLFCKTDTSRDVGNCGACGNECPTQPSSHHATSVCTGGKCAIACDELAADCNHQDSDGCEVLTGDDPLHCGGCGNVCKTGDICWKGACGCPTGFTQCGNECKNTDHDNLACGSCDTKCVPPKSDSPEWLCGPNKQPPSTEWTCSGGGCHISCMHLFGDCNFDLCADGCEVDAHNDPLNCGGCGHKCDAGQDCMDGTCMCPPGTVRCDNRCVDVNVDPDNCGACGNGCLGAQDQSANGSPTCSKGRCGYVCYAGFANCNSRLDDGCEANVANDPLNCGGCGTKCDAAQSQPCVLGQCLSKPCGPAAGTF